MPPSTKDKFGNYTATDTSGLNTTSASPITAASLAPAVKSDFAVTPPADPIPVPPPPAPIVAETPAPLTPLEQRMQDEANKALAAQDALVGMEGYRTEQQNLAGTGEKQKLITDLNAELTSVHNEIKQQQLSLEGQGRGQTTDFLNRQQTEIGRQGAIKALEISSTLAAAQGNLQNAMDMADRAVAAKYGPIEAQLKTSMANLELISKNPQYTADQKKRADAQIAVQQKKLDAIATEKENAKAVNDALIKTIQYNQGIDQLSMSALRSAKSPAEFAMIASYLGLETMSPQDKADVAYKEAQTASLGNPDLQFVSGTDKQRAGTFNKKTGVFTPIGGGTSVTDANGNVVSGASYLGPDGKALSNDAVAYGEIYANTGNMPSAAELKQAGISAGDVREASQLFPSPMAKKTLPMVEDKIKLLERISASDFLDTAVGPNPVPRTSFSNWFSGGKTDVLGDITQLVSKETLSTLLELKNAGGTLGAISEKELAILEGAATKIAKAAIMGGTDNKEVVGYDMAEKYFREEIDKIKGSAERLKAELEKEINKKGPQMNTIPTAPPQGDFRAKYNY